MSKTARFKDGLIFASVLPRLTLDDGTVEAIKWLAVVLMTVDHVNKYLLHDAYASMFAIGRLAMPLFGFVLAYNLARPCALERGVYFRVAIRLGIFGAIATVPFMALGGLIFGWWPLNIMAMLAVSTGCIYLISQGGTFHILLALFLFALGGAFVEFWWPAISMCIAAWFYCKRPGWISLAFWVASTAALFIVNRNFWAVAVFPLVFMAPFVRLSIPRLKMGFYAYYPAHLAVIWALSRFV